MSSLSICLLGWFELFGGEGEPLLPPPTLNGRSLLDYLIVHRERPQPRERFADRECRARDVRYPWAAEDGRHGAHKPRAVWWLLVSASWMLGLPASGPARILMG